MRLIVYFVLLSVLLTACAKNNPTPIVETVVQTVTVKPNIPLQNIPDSVNMLPIEFYVVTEDNFDEFKVKFLSKGNQFVFVAISIGDYENLALNVADLQRYIEQQGAIIIFYEESIS